MSKLDYALEYADLGWSVIPLAPGSKIPPKGFSPVPYRSERATHGDINDWYKDNPDYNIGIITGEISDILAIDHDLYKKDYDAQAALELIPDDIITPTSETPRKGQHQIFQFPKYENESDRITIGSGLIPGLDWRGEGGHFVAPGSADANGLLYKWMDGLGPREIRPCALPAALKRRLINNKIISTIRECDDSTAAPPKMFADGRRDNDLFTVANALTKGGLPAEYIAQVLENLIISWGEKPDPSWISAKVKSASDRADRRDRTLAQDVKDWVLSTSGNFLSTEVYNCLQLSTREDRKNVSIILKRLCEDGIIEKCGNKNGQFRLINTELEPLDWMSAATEPLDLRMPFGIEHLVKLYPGNVAVIAGFPNAGKTAFIQNFIRFNQDRYPIHLFSSEGGPEELKMRLSKFGYPLESWNFKSWNRTGNFADVIRPDAVNIIDYLEIHDDFYKVGGMIKAISDKLTSGFALIALQKNTGRDEGLGGARGLEKPRLYMAMEPGRLKIVKAKSWVDSSDNPNGKSIKFKILDGCRFIIESRWERAA